MLRATFDLQYFLCNLQYVAFPVMLRRGRKTLRNQGSDLDLRNITVGPQSVRRKAMMAASRFHVGVPSGSA